MARMQKEVMDVFNDPSSAEVLATAGSTAVGPKKEVARTDQGPES